MCLKKYRNCRNCRIWKNIYKYTKRNFKKNSKQFANFFEKMQMLKMQNMQKYLKICKNIQKYANMFEKM